MGDPQSMNRYSYALNNPCIYTDPLGLAPTCTINVSIGGVGGLEIQNQIIRLFVQAKVGVNFNTTPQSADFTLTFVDTNEFRGKTNIRLVYGALGQSQGNYGWVFVNKTVIQLLVEGHPGDANLVTSLGSVGAHEIMHGLGLTDVGAMGNLMGPGTHVDPRDQTLTKAQKDQLLAACQSKRSGSRSGGGGGSNGDPGGYDDGLPVYTLECEYLPGSSEGDYHYYCYFVLSGGGEGKGGGLRTW